MIEYKGKKYKSVADVPLPNLDDNSEENLKYTDDYIEIMLLFEAENADRK